MLTKLMIMLSSAAICLTTSLAQAGILLEPYAGYSQGKTDAHAKPAGVFPGGDASDTFSEADVGFKIGAKASGLGLWVAVDPELGLSGMAKDNASGNSSGYTRTQIFADLGADFSIFRAYVGYGVMNEMKDSDSKLSGGTALKVGLEISLFSDIALLAEYHTNDFKEVAGSNGTNQIADVYDTFKQSRFVIGLAIPLSGLSDKR